MHLKRIHLLNFRSYADFVADFSPQVNCIVGDNGSGKTNLLDAVYFLALTKSALLGQDALCIRHEADYMLVEGVFEKDNKVEQITATMQRGQRKAFLHDKKPYERIADHIGKYPVVLISPDDTDLIRDATETRRRLFDGMQSQLSSSYLQNYQLYNRLLDQRNGLLRQFAQQHYFDAALLDAYSEPLIELAISIQQARRQFVDTYLPLVKKHYAALSESRESIDILYESEVNSQFLQEFQQARSADLHAQRTTKGIHRDDYVFELDGYPIKKFGSQGQKKSFVMALRLAQFELLEQQHQQKPLVLLDDIFDKLDDRRISKLLDNITTGTFGQVFLTDARPERIQKLIEHLDVEAKYFYIQR